MLTLYMYNYVQALFDRCVWMRVGTFTCKCDYDILDV